MKATILLVTACLPFLVLVAPVRAHAEMWDYLFEDLSWPEARVSVSGGLGASIGGDIGAGTDSGASGQGSFWGYLFTDLSWPNDVPFPGQE